MLWRVISLYFFKKSQWNRGKSVILSPKYGLFKFAVVVESLSHVWLFGTPWTAVGQAFLSITTSWSLLKFTSLESFPASGSFPLSWLFASGGHSIEASASVLPMNIQGWFPLRMTGWISLLFKWLSRVFSNTTIQIHQFFDAQLSFFLYSSK